MYLTASVVQAACIVDEVERKIRMLKERLEDDDWTQISVDALWAELTLLHRRLSQVTLVKDVDFRSETVVDEDSTLMYMKILRQIKARAIHFSEPLAIVPYNGWWANFLCAVKVAWWSRSLLVR